MISMNTGIIVTKTLCYNLIFVHKTVVAAYLKFWGKKVIDHPQRNRNTNQLQVCWLGIKTARYTDDGEAAIVTRILWGNLHRAVCNTAPQIYSTNAKPHRLLIKNDQSLTTKYVTNQVYSCLYNTNYPPVDYYNYTLCKYRIKINEIYYCLKISYT